MKEKTSEINKQLGFYEEASVDDWIKQISDSNYPTKEEDIMRLVHLKSLGISTVTKVPSDEISNLLIPYVSNSIICTDGKYSEETEKFFHTGAKYISFDEKTNWFICLIKKNNNIEGETDNYVNITLTSFDFDINKLLLELKSQLQTKKQEDSIGYQTPAMVKEYRLAHCTKYGNRKKVC